MAANQKTCREHYTVFCCPVNFSSLREREREREKGVGWGGGAIKGRNSNNYTAQFVTVISIFHFAIFLFFRIKWTSSESRVFF